LIVKGNDGLKIMSRQVCGRRTGSMRAWLGAPALQRCVRSAKVAACHPLVYAAAFVALAFVKAPGLFIDPRFWAEEGIDFAKMLHAPVIDDLLQVNIGNYQFLFNASVLAATLVPLPYAPAVTTAVGLLAHTIVAFQLGLLVRAYKLSAPVGVMLLLAWVFLPQTYEVWLNVTNVQWVMGVSMLLLLTMPDDVLNRRKTLVACWAILCGLSGIPAVLLAPFFLVGALARRCAGRAAAGAALLVGAVVEVACTLGFGTPGRNYPLDPILLALAPILQTVIDPLAGVDLTTAIGRLVRDEYPRVGPTTLAVLVAGSAAMLAIVAAACRSAGRELVFYILAAWVGISVIQTFAGRDVGPEYFSGLAASRYYLLGSVCLCILLAWGTTAEHAFARKGTFFALALIAAVGLFQRVACAWPGVLLFGPSWSRQVRACAPSIPICRIEIWPAGGAWHVHLESSF
jgi:hypothetical protein